MSLLALQGGFRDLLLDESAVTNTAYAAGLSVYRNAYRERLVEYLRKTFDKTWTWIGDEAFDAVALQHIAQHPPSSWTLDDYGTRFHETLESRFPDEPEVADLAWLEAAVQRAFGSPDSPSLTPEALTSYALTHHDWEDTRFAFVTSLQTRVVRMNCIDIWRAIASETDPPAEITRFVPATLCVWRKALSPEFRILDADEALTFELIANTATFGQICESMYSNKEPSEAAAAVGTLLGRWINDAMIAELPI